MSLFATTHILRATPLRAFDIRVHSLRESSFRASLSSTESRSYSETQPANMPRGVKKENLPSKVCVVCERPFTWRKKWERVWDEVTTCSKSCNHKRRAAKRDNSNCEHSNRGATNLESITIQSSFGENVEEDLNSVPMSSRVNLGGAHEGDTAVVSPLGSDINGPAEGLEVNPYHSCDDPVILAKKQRKALKKAKKAERRAQREGHGDPCAGQKSCDMCGKSVDLLVRCMYEEGQLDWKMVCGKCWNTASGGVVDGDTNHPYYRYGGLWKNRRAQT